MTQSNGHFFLKLIEVHYEAVTDRRDMTWLLWSNSSWRVLVCEYHQEIQLNFIAMWQWVVIWLPMYHVQVCGVCTSHACNRKGLMPAHSRTMKPTSTAPTWTASLFIPMDKHFWYRQYWHRFLCLLSMVHDLSSRQAYVKSLRTVRLKKPLQPSQLQEDLN